MKIKKKILVEFLTRVRTNEIETCLLEFKPDAVYVNVASPAGTHMVMSKLYTTAFSEYKDIGNIGIDELSKFIKVIKKFNDELDIDVQGNLMIIKKDKNKVEFELIDEKFIEKPDTDKKFEHDNSFIITGEQMSSFIDKANENNDYVINIKTVDNGVILSNTGKYKFTDNIDSEGTKSGDMVNFQTPLINCVEQVKTGDLKCYIKTDYPMIIEHDTEFFSIKFMVAPLIQNE